MGRYVFECEKSGKNEDKSNLTPIHVSTILPSFINIDQLQAKFISFFQDKNFQIKEKENNLNISQISKNSSEDCKSANTLDISIRLFLPLTGR